MGNTMLTRAENDSENSPEPGPYILFEITGKVQMRSLDTKFQPIMGTTFDIAIRPVLLRGISKKILNISKGGKEDWIVVVETDDLIYGLPEKNFYNYVEMGSIEITED